MLTFLLVLAAALAAIYALTGLLAVHYPIRLRGDLYEAFLLMEAES
jgi:hypothetical protein